ncbi:MAG: NADPH:quinone reductase [Gammaproteobacteria bacterium]|nr:NADPH:quinone reductase [Gammaproteobacteria bacterium]
MRAISYTQVGPAREVLQAVELPTPRPGPGEVRVRLITSGVNPSDVKTRSGMRSKVLPFPRLVPHSDGAGVIDEIGSGVAPARLGERVWIWNGCWGRADGTAAEFIVLPTAQAVTLPDAVDFAAGACLGIPALTALHAVLMDGGVRGKNVLVPGGAGAVGHYAIQLAKHYGAAKVITTISGPAKADLARAAGADEIINYRTEDVPARIQALCKGVDRVLEVDLSTNIILDHTVLKPEGDIVVYGSSKPDISVPFAPSIIKNIRYRFFMVYHLAPSDRAHAERELGELLRAGRLRHNIAARFPLAETVAAHEAVESGTLLGNVVIDLA